MSSSSKLIKDRKLAVTSALLFLFYTLIHLIFLWGPTFDTDEEDITVGGKAIARGFVLYKEYTSQHMPFSYYVSAVFEFFGAHSIYAQRFMFYLLFALMWVIIYRIYRKDFNPKALAFYPVLFTLVTCSYEYGTCILSEHLAGIGFVILFLEYLRFKSFRDLTWQQCVLISVALLFTFGTIFVAAFGVAVIFVAVLVKEITDIVRSKSSHADLHMNKRILNMAKLIGIVLAPWAVYCIYLLASGTFDVFIYSAYTINRTIYPKYLGGFGDGPLWSIASAISVGFAALTDLSVMENAIIIVGFIGFLAVLYRKGRLVESVFSLALVIMCGSRGFFTFHGSHCIELMCLMGSMFFFECCFDYLKDTSKAKMLPLIVTGLCCLVILGPFADCLMYLTRVEVPIEKPIVGLLKEITDEDEGIWICTTDNDLFQQADRAPIYGISLSPWWYEAHEERVFNEIGEEPPRICILDVGYDVWGAYKVDEYGANMINYVREHYTMLSCREAGTRVYVRNDMIDTIPEQYR